MLCCLFVPWLSGCSKETASLEISGQATFQGKPIEKGMISFTPEDGRTSATVADIRDGRYTVRLSPGPKCVQISWMKKVAEQKAMVAGQLRSVDVMREAIPEQFNTKSNLRREVSVDSNRNKDFNFNL
jgi:hypothetical protein